MKDLELNNKDTMSSTELLEMLHFESKSSLNKAIRKMFQEKIDDARVESSLNPNGTVAEYPLIGVFLCLNI